MKLDAVRVQGLVRAQFPGWSGMPVRELVPGGWDHHTFRLGKRLVIRLPRGAEYASQVEKEHRWLPYLARLVTLEIPALMALGRPGPDFPYPWSVRRWIEGEAAASRDSRSVELARDLARFLRELQGIDATDAPAPGAHNFHRGGALAFYDEEVREALRILRPRIDADAALRLWQQALASAWRREPVWIHGDVGPGNLLLRQARLAGVIDFGGLAAGDPACDLAIAWSFFDGTARKAFMRAMDADDETWSRARGWALWKAAIVAAQRSVTNAPEFANPEVVISRVLLHA